MNDGIEARREEAIDRLRDAWTSGRIDPGEHERRTTALRHATTPEQVEAAERGDFAGLSWEPSAGATVAPIPPVEGRAPTEPGSPVVSYEPSRRGLSPQVTQAILGVTPFVAVILFFLTRDVMSAAWIWFLLIPIVWTVLPALGGDSGDAHAERRERRRELKRARRHS